VETSFLPLYRPVQTRSLPPDHPVQTSSPLTGRAIILWQAAAPKLVSLTCCIGDGMTQPLLLVELATADVDAGHEGTQKELLAALATANASQPAYSQVKPQHVLLLPPGSLPRTVKGSAQRGTASKSFAIDADAALKGRSSSYPTLASPSDSTLAFDSLATSSKGGGDKGRSEAEAGAPDPQLVHLNGLLGVCSMFVVPTAIRTEGVATEPSRERCRW
jgi:hypothetical protein